jgi:hypothetical protein
LISGADRDADGNRTHFDRVAAGCLAVWLQRLMQCPRQESNLVLDLRRVVRYHHAPRTLANSIPAGTRTRIRALGEPNVVRYTTRMSRADDWIRTSMSRLTRSVPGLFEPRRHKQERRDSNPMRRFWRPFALPGAHSCRLRHRSGQGRLGGVEPAAKAFTEPCARPLHYRHHRGPPVGGPSGRSGS